uniref:t-SNARE coiled-coil homology domain-containing protein n=1 Tax=Stomoxys calcitrans TaxID=35570 RepID=A0A1I8P4H6_STOCA
MSDKYLQPVNNHFAFDSNLEDVDDNEFLKNSRNPRNNGNGSENTGGRGGAIPRHIDGNNSDNCQDEAARKHQIFEQKRREIEERTLESTQRSLGLLYDSEQVGTSTAVELAKQREQLERTNRNLDDINASLRYSQKHLNGIKSVFGSIRNYFSGSRETPNTVSERKLSSDSHSSQPADRAKIDGPSVASSTIRYEQHPISRLRDDVRSQQNNQTQNTARSNQFETQLETNLNDMCDNLSRLKNLASELGTEIETQNELLDNMNYKIEDVDMKLSRQNKDISKLLGKK